MPSREKRAMTRPFGDLREFGECNPPLACELRLSRGEGMSRRKLSPDIEKCRLLPEADLGEASADEVDIVVRLEEE